MTVKTGGIEHAQQFRERCFAANEIEDDAVGFEIRQNCNFALELGRASCGKIEMPEVTIFSEKKSNGVAFFGQEFVVIDPGLELRLYREKIGAESGCTGLGLLDGVQNFGGGVDRTHHDLIDA